MPCRPLKIVFSRTSLEGIMAQLRIGQEGVRFRRLLVAHDLAKCLFEAVTRNLEKNRACVRKGTLIDAIGLALV
jgi:hypothetical protein